MCEQSTSSIVPKELRLSPEFRLVAACSWIPRSEHSLRQNLIIDSLVNNQINWDEVGSLVHRHGVVGQFCLIMGTRDWVNVPIETKKRLKNIRVQQAVRSLSQVAELARVGKLFTDAGIPMMPLKGVALSQELYGDPCVRSSADLDILVQPDDIEKAEEILIQAGYRHALGFHSMGERQKNHIINTLHHHEYINDTRQSHIELHWRSYLWTRDQITALWETCSSSTWLNAGLSQLSREHNILFLADHGARHGWLSMKWLSDLAMLMQDLPVNDWLSLHEKAAFFDLQRIIVQTTTLLEWFYGMEPPEKFKELSLPGAKVQKLSFSAAFQLAASADDIALQAKRFPWPRHSLRLKQLKPSTPLSALIRGLLIIHSDFVELPLPNSLFWLYLPLRPFFWFKRHYLNRTSS